MKIKFDLSDILFEIKADIPYKELNRMGYEYIMPTMTFTGDQIAPLLGRQMERQQQFMEMGESTYKFDAEVSVDENTWTLHGCFIESCTIESSDCFGDEPLEIAVDIMVDCIPELI